MIIETTTRFTLDFPGPPEDALAFVRDPARALSRVQFLRDLSAGPEGVRGELVVHLPVLGEADLPFESRLEVREGGAALLPRLLQGERAWVEVGGVAALQPAQDALSTPLSFEFQFRAHLSVPTPAGDAGAADPGLGWGGAAFGKMVRAAAGRTLERVTRELPESIRQSMPGGQRPGQTDAVRGGPT